MSVDIYSPDTFRDTWNTLASFRPAQLSHPTLNSAEIGAFQAERLLEAGYVIRYDPARADAILAGRKS